MTPRRPALCATLTAGRTRDLKGTADTVSAGMAIASEI